MSIQEYYARDAQRKKRRKASAAFNAKMVGEKVRLPNEVIKKQIDHIASLIVRRRDRKIHAGLCLICMAKERMCILKRPPNPITLAYHIVPRGDMMTRWDLRNMVGACGPCNQGELWSRSRASSKELYRNIHIALIGEKTLLEIEMMATQTADFDLIAKRDEMKAILEGRQ